MEITNMSQWLRKTSIVILVLTAAILKCDRQAQAAETVVFTHGGASQSVSVAELQTFASTGETSPSINTILKFGNQNPFIVRWILKQQFPANTKLIYDLLNTAPGEHALSQTGDVVSAKSKRANVKALRGTLVASASDDNLISSLELLEKYPTKEVYIDGKALAKVQQNLANFISETNKIYQDTFNSATESN